jgi:hypothetical protein
MQQYQTDSTMLYNALTQIGTALDSTGTNYSGPEQTSYSKIVNVQLPPARLG